MRPLCYTLFIILLLGWGNLLSAQEFTQAYEGKDTFWVLPLNYHYKQFLANSLQHQSAELPDGLYRQYIYEEEDEQVETPVGYYSFSLRNGMLNGDFAHALTAKHTLEEGYFLDGKQHAFWHVFSPDTALLNRETYYENGQIMQMVYYNEKETIFRRDIHFHEVDDAEKVLTTWFHSDGTPARQGVTLVLEAGQRCVKKEGQWRTWYQDGQLRSVEYYTSNDYIGECKYYNEIGKLSRVATYKNGKLKNEVVYQYEDASLVMTLFKDKNGKVKKVIEL